MGQNGPHQENDSKPREHQKQSCGQSDLFFIFDNHIVLSSLFMIYICISHSGSFLLVTDIQATITMCRCLKGLSTVNVLQWERIKSLGRKDKTKVVQINWGEDKPHINIQRDNQQ